MKYKPEQSFNNILMVANYSSDVGFAWWLMENFWAEISHFFSDKGKECFLIYPQVKNLPDIIFKSNIKVIEHDFSKKDYKSIVKLINIVRTNKIGHVYLTDKPYYDWLYYVLRISGVNKIVNHDHMPGERPKISILKKIIKKSFHLFGTFSCDHYIGVSKFVKDRLINIACIPENKCSYIHNGIEIFDNYNSNYTHNLFNIPDDSKIVVTTGRASFYKGIDKLIKCSNEMLNNLKIEKLYFLHIGDGPDLEKFKNLATHLNVGDKFIFAGFRKDITKILPCCDIGIQTSDGEAFSLSILEYLCAGLATLAPDNCGNREAILNDFNGILYSPGNISEMVEKINSLLNDVNYRMRLGRNARETVLTKFKLNICNQKLITLLEKEFL